MNKLTIIGNLTKAPESRVVNSQNGQIPVCTFTVAVNGKRKSDESTFFRVTAWRTLAQLCGKLLSKGKKVCVTGAVGVRTYQANDGSTRASLEVTADDFEIVSSNAPAAQNEQQQTVSPAPMQTVNVDDLPF